MKPIEQYPTPATNAAQIESNLEMSKDQSSDWNLNAINRGWNACRAMEQKLAACRDLLACINSSQILPQNLHDEISETIKATAP